MTNETHAVARQGDADPSRDANALIEDTPRDLVEAVAVHVMSPDAGASTLTTDQVAEQLGVHLVTVGMWIRTGRLPAERAPRGNGMVGYRYVVRQQALTALVAARVPDAVTKKKRDMQRALATQRLPEAQQPRTLAEAVAYHQRLLERLRRAESSKRSYRIYLGQLLLFLEERGIEPGLDVLTPRLAGECLDWMRGRHNEARAHQGGAAADAVFIRSVKGFTRALTEQGVYAEDPLARLKRLRPPKPNRQPYTEAELSAMLEATASRPLPARDRALLLLLLDTGCRIGELCAADVGDVDLERGSVTFRKTKNGEPRQVLFGVGGDGGPCLAALRNWLATREVTPSSPLFTGDVLAGRPRLPHATAFAVQRRHAPSREPARLSTQHALRIVKAIGKAAGVNNSINHRFRHTSATQFLSRRPGAEIQLRSRLGHLSDAVLANYVHMTQAMAEDGAQVASISSRLLTSAPTPLRPETSRLQTLQSILALLERDPGLRTALAEVLAMAATA